MNKSLEQRFWSKVEFTDECWLWTGAPTRWGYGQFSVGTYKKQKMVRPHRLAYELLVGPIPEGLSLDHVCHNRDTECVGGTQCIHRLCVNPDHLEPVTRGENVRRGQSGFVTGALSRAKTSCPQGHVYSEENTYLYKTFRACRTCRKVADLKHRKKEVLL